MKNQKVFASIILIVAVIIAGYFVLSGKNTTSNWKVYRDEALGLELRYPPNFFVGDKNEVNAIVVEFSEGPGSKADSSALNAINIYAPSANGASSFTDYLSKYPIVDQNSGKPIEFKERTLGSNVFYYARMERFEGVLAFGYYIIHGDTIYQFASISKGVDWTNPNLDEHNDPVHVILRQMLSTIKFTK
jgi:hypothetical protein